MLLVVTGLKREARIAAGDGVITVSVGGDPASFTRQFAEALGKSILGVVSFGIAGALAPDLAPGDVVLATQLIDEASMFDCNAEWLKSVATKIPDARAGAIAASSTILADIAAKTALYEKTKALATDMESHLAATAAKQHGLPFIAIRAISDGADHLLPPAALAAMKPDGSLDGFAIARSIFAKPTQIPDLIRTGRESERAFSALLRCRDVIGSRFAFPDLG